MLFEENDLPPAYLDEIVEYIKKNVVEARGVQSKEDAAYDNKVYILELFLDKASAEIPNKLRITCSEAFGCVFETQSFLSPR